MLKYILTRGTAVVGLMGLFALQPGMAASKYAAIVVDGKTGTVLHQDRADAPRFPASLTKIMTLYVLFDYLTRNRLDRETKFYITPYGAGRPPTRMGLRSGQYVKVKHLIGSLITKSANDGATVIAENLAGTEANFARMMTRTARRLGMKNTTFQNASGLPHAYQKTTARDMAILGARIYKDFPEFSKAFKTKYYRFGRKSFRNHNRLLFNYKGTEGIKTGYTRASGFNLTTSVRVNGRHVIAVVMGGRTGGWRNRKMRKLLNKYLPRAKSIRGRRSPKIFANVKLSDHPVTASMFQPVIPGARAIAAINNSGTARVIQTAGRAEQDINAGYSGKFKRRSLAKYSWDYDLQIGSFTSENEANDKLSLILASAGNKLQQHPPFTIKFKKNETIYYRARFADFSKKRARTVCSGLKKRGFDCLPMPAN